jgi:hypothetical protein
MSGVPALEGSRGSLEPKNTRPAWATESELYLRRKKKEYINFHFFFPSIMSVFYHYFTPLFGRYH